MPHADVSESPKTAIELPRSAIAAFCRKWQVREFAVFGSVLRDDFRPDSDVDVMVEFDAAAKPTLYDLVDMQEELQALFGRKVDLLTRRAVEQMSNRHRRQHVLESARVVYAA